LKKKQKNYFVKNVFYKDSISIIYLLHNDRTN